MKQLCHKTYKNENKLTKLRGGSRATAKSKIERFVIIEKFHR